MSQLHYRTTAITFTSRDSMNVLGWMRLVTVVDGVKFPPAHGHSRLMNPVTWRSARLYMVRVVVKIGGTRPFDVSIALENYLGPIQDGC